MTNKITFEVMRGHEILFSSESAQEAGKFYDENKDKYPKYLRIIQSIGY